MYRLHTGTSCALSRPVMWSIDETQLTHGMKLDSETEPTPRFEYLEWLLALASCPVGAWLTYVSPGSVLDAHRLEWTDLARDP